MLRLQNGLKKICIEVEEIKKVSEENFKNNRKLIKPFSEIILKSSLNSFSRNHYYGNNSLLAAITDSLMNNKLFDLISIISEKGFL